MHSYLTSSLCTIRDLVDETKYKDAGFSEERHVINLSQPRVLSALTWRIHYELLHLIYINMLCALTYTSHCVLQRILLIQWWFLVNETKLVQYDHKKKLFKTHRVWCTVLKSCTPF